MSNDKNPKPKPGIVSDPLRGRSISSYPTNASKNSSGIFKPKSGDLANRLNDKKAGPKTRPRKKA